MKVPFASNNLTDVQFPPEHMEYTWPGLFATRSHLLAMILAVASGQPSAWLSWGADPAISTATGYGYGLGTVYAFWVLTLFLLYFPTRRFANLKKTRRATWMSYL